MAFVDLSYARNPATGELFLDAYGYPQVNPNPSANTSLQLQQRIAYEVLGSPTTNDVQNAILDAIAMHERDTFYFNTFRLFGGTGVGSASGLAINNGAVNLNNPQGAWPTTPPTSGFWNNNGQVDIAGTPSGPTVVVLYGQITDTYLLNNVPALSLPTSDPSNIGQLWNNSGVLDVSLWQSILVPTPYGLAINGGTVILYNPTANWPTSPQIGFYSNSGLVSIGGSPTGPGTPVYFYSVTDASLLSNINPLALPAVNPAVVGQLWNDGGVLAVSQWQQLTLNQNASTIQTTLGKEFYSDADFPSLLNMPHLSKIMVLAFNNRYELRNRTAQWIADQSLSTTWQGLPTDWCIQDDGSIRIYPVPNGTYPLILENATIRFRPPQFGSDYSPWTNRGERLIRYTAKMLLFRDIIRDQAQTAVFEKEVFGDPMQPGKVGELGRLKKESFRRTGGPGRMRASRGYMRWRRPQRLANLPCFI